jgi:hypothetical protein
MIVTLDDVRCLLSLPIQGRPLNHTGLPNKKDGVTWMKDLLGTKKREVEDEVRKTKGAHIIFVFLKKLITKHLERMRTAQRDKDPDGEDKAKVLVMIAYLMLLVETTIFSNKAKNYIDLTYLDYFRHLDRIHTYAWGTVALAFLYRKLTHGTHPNCKYVVGYMTLLQVTFI